jgi:outer membrane protein OmpA-like peptidoglycan-associated protein
MRYKRFFCGVVIIYIQTVAAATLSAQRLDTLYIHFHSNESKILSEDSLAMDKLLRSRSRILSVSLSGHCDYIGNDRYNDSLAGERVRATRAWLVAWGLKGSLFLDSNDYGKRRPLNDNATDQKRRLNRRVEIVFNSMDPVARSISALDSAFKDTAHLSGRKNILLQEVNFYPDKHIPMGSGYRILQELRKILQENPTIRIEVQGYVCCNSPDRDGYDDDTRTEDLSLQRAKFIYQYLIKGGIDSSRLAYRGFAGSHPLCPNESNDWEKTMNRRVEIKILPSAHATAPSDDTPGAVVVQQPLSLHEQFKDTANLVGKNIILHNVNFYGDRHQPLPGSTIVLQELAAILKEYPTLHIEIQGYVCCMSDKFDGRDADLGTPDLSKQRAKFVYEFLVGQGIKKDRLSYKGFGASNKIYPEEKDEAQKTANRRVEIKIVTFSP